MSRILKTIRWRPKLFTYDYSPTYNKISNELAQNITLPNVNKKITNFIGQGYINNKTNHFLTNTIIKNPKWHSAYAAYQSEISQGRLTIFNEYQNLIKILTNKMHTNSSMLDDSTAMVDAVNSVIAKNKLKKVSIVADNNLYFYRKEVLKTFSTIIGWDLKFIDLRTENLVGGDILITQTHNTYGELTRIGDDFRNQIGSHIHFLDPKYALLYDPPDADIMVGTMQSFGLPLMSGGPHVGFMAANKEYQRFIPGKVVIDAKDKYGTPMYRLGLQTREQHIKRERAISNICTNQSLMATYVTCWTALNGFYKLQDDMMRVSSLCSKIVPNSFDTISMEITNPKIFQRLENSNMEIFRRDEKNVSYTIDWTHTDDEIYKLADLLDCDNSHHAYINYCEDTERFNSIFFSKWNNNELGFARYLQNLSKRDFTLIDGSIPLGSCTMKYNPPIIFDALDNTFLRNLHPYSKKMELLKPSLNNFKTILSDFVGMDNVSFQPMSGSHGELTSLLMIKKYFQSSKQDRNIILLPLSCHGTNSASCRIAGFKIENINDLDTKTNFYESLLQTLEKIDPSRVAGIMITFPNTFGFFDDNIVQTLEKMKEIGAISYLDGANMNSWLGFLAPGKMGFDIAHINLHKTLAVPHGGGGPGSGPILCKKFLEPYLPNCYLNNSEESIGQVSSSPFGNTLAVFFSYLYTKSCGLHGIIQNTSQALMNANYLKKRLSKIFNIPYSDKDGLVSHELLINTANIYKKGVTETDICKRLMDYGIHPPTVSWPITRCFLIEPTESETYESLDYIVEAFEKIMDEIENDKDLIKNAPHNLRGAIESDKPIEKVLFPHSKQNEENKFWISSARVDEVSSDKNALK